MPVSSFVKGNRRYVTYHDVFIHPSSLSMVIYAQSTFLRNRIYNRGSTSISKLEQGLESSKLANTLGCKIPSEPSLKSRPDPEFEADSEEEDDVFVEIGRTDLRLAARVSSGPLDSVDGVDSCAGVDVVGVGLVSVVDGAGGGWKRSEDAGLGL